MTNGTTKQPEGPDDASAGRDVRGRTDDHTEEDPTVDSRSVDGELIAGNYRVSEVLGEGGMGSVLLAQDEKLQRPVAIKLIHPHLLTRDFRERFLFEARAMARVRHENVVTIHTFGEHEQIPFFVMEFVPGGSLEQWLVQWNERHGSLSVDHAIGILTQICGGLQAIHDAGAVHHDLKPGNVLIGSGFRLAITDLGLARMITDSGELAKALQAGTPSHIPPELIDSDASSLEAARLADIYMLGVTAYELFTGRLPFEGELIDDILVKHLVGKPPKPSSLRPEIPTVFDEALLAPLSKDPSSRPPSPDALLAAVVAVRKGIAASVRRRSRILVVDDDPDYSELVATVVREAIPTADITVVGDGEAAMAQLERLPYTVALVDLQMPKMNGFELVAAMRSMESARRTRIIISTAVGGAGDWRVLARLGAEAFLVKPVIPAELVRTVKRMLSTSAPPPLDR